MKTDETHWVRFQRELHELVAKYAKSDDLPPGMVIYGLVAKAMDISIKVMPDKAEAYKAMLEAMQHVGGKE